MFREVRECHLKLPKFSKFPKRKRPKRPKRPERPERSHYQQECPSHHFGPYRLFGPYGPYRYYQQKCPSYPFGLYRPFGHLVPYSPLLALRGISPLYLPKIPSQIPLIYIHCYYILCNMGNIVGDKRSNQEQGLNPQRCTTTHLTFIPANKQPYDTTLKRERMQTPKSTSSIIYYTIVSPNWQWQPKD